MPLYYFRPFKFFPPKRPKVVDIPTSDIALWVVVGLVGLILFAVFVIVPVVLTLNQMMPAG